MGRIYFEDKILNLKIHGKVEISLEKTDARSYYEVIDKDELSSMEQYKNTIIFNNKDEIDKEEYFPNTYKNKEKKERNVLSILSGIVFDFSKIIINSEDFREKQKTFKVRFYINDYMDFHIDGDNLDINVNNLKMNNLIIDCANVNFTGINYSLGNLSIDSSNLKAQLLFDSFNNKININSNNTKLYLLVKSNFNGKVELDYNNLKITGDKSIYHNLNDSRLGLLKADVNNVKIDFKEI